MANKLYCIQIVLAGGPIMEHRRYNNVPQADMLVMENVFLGFGTKLNANPPKPQVETAPRIPTLYLSCDIKETQRDGQVWPQPKPFFGPVLVPWHDVPAYGAPYIWAMVDAMLTPWMRYLGA